LKALLAFAQAAGGSQETSESALVAAGKEFAAGDDQMRVYRQLYVASRLLRLGKGLDTAHDLLKRSRSGVEDALSVPVVTVAVQADELREIRSRAIASGGTPNVPEAPVNVLSNILRGRIEDLTGWVLFNQDKPAEAVDHLRRAASVLPEGTPSWTTALWHLGAALEQTGQKEEALNYYIKSYSSGAPDTVRRNLIEQLYVKVNGSNAGLDERIGKSTAELSAAISAGSTNGTNVTNGTTTPAVTSTPDSGPATTPTPVVEPTAAPRVSESTTDLKPQPESATPKSENPATRTELTPPESSPAVTQETRTEAPVPTPEASPASSPEASPAVQQDANAANKPVTTIASSEPSLADLPTKTETPAKLPAVLKVSGRVRDAAGNGIENVVVVLISPRGSVLASTTDTEGNYSFSVSPSDKPFRLIPSKEGLVFTPVDKSLLIQTEDYKDIDFTSAPANKP
jgi:hypothetical protein